MKIITTDLPDSYMKLLEESSICVGINRPEHIRLEIRETLRQELGLVGELENELEVKKSVGFFDNCINCGEMFHSRAKMSHFFHKDIEVFVLRFCCACYNQFRDIPFNDFPAHLIENIRKNREQYKKSLD